MSKIDFIKANKDKWNKKTEIKEENKLFKIIGVGPKALKVLWFGPTPGTQTPVWNQCWWNYENLDNLAKKVIDKMYNELQGA